MVVLGALVGATQAEELAGYSGADLYRRFCASCHGVTAHGDGPVSESLKLMVPDLTLLSRRHGGAFPADQVRRIIDGRSIRPPHGERDMPVWGFEFRAAGGDGGQTDQLIDRLINYLQSLQH
jgi:mono/diheme cytochrome c family protein